MRVLPVALIVLSALTLTGCGLISGIFQAGAMVGALAVIAVLLILGFLIVKLIA
jgi:hypothetical protein